MGRRSSGDFNNGAQIIIDQFIAAGAAKWGETTRLTMLLPHGYEGAGPEHSSARWSGSCCSRPKATFWWRIARMQRSTSTCCARKAKSAEAYPLVVMTPKSLLRNRAAYGKLDELVDGSFHPVIDDPRFEAAADRSKIERLLLCSGKIYYDLTVSPLYAKTAKTAIARVELLSPLPADAILALIDSYPNLRSSRGSRKSRRTWARAPTCGGASSSVCRKNSTIWTLSALVPGQPLGGLPGRARGRARAHHPRSPHRRVARADRP